MVQPAVQVLPLFLRRFALSSGADRLCGCGLPAAETARISSAQSCCGFGLPPGLQRQLAEVAGGEPRLLEAVPRGPSGCDRPQPDATASQGSRAPRARSCKQQLGSGPKVLLRRCLTL